MLSTRAGVGGWSAVNQSGSRRVECCQLERESEGGVLSTRAIVGGWNAVNLTQYHNYYRLSLVSGLLELHLNKINMHG